MTTLTPTPRTVSSHATIGDSLAAVRERTIARRWAEWRPFAEYRARQMSTVQISYTTLLNVFEDTHRRALDELLRAGVRLSVIDRERLDDPLQSEVDRGVRIAAAIERRRARMNRVKGQTRARYRRIQDADRT